jgi:hypothetical protein
MVKAVDEAAIFTLLMRGHSQHAGWGSVELELLT